MDYLYLVLVWIITANQWRSLEPFLFAELLISSSAWSSGMVSFLFSPFLSGSIALSVVYNMMYVWEEKKRNILQIVCLKFKYWTVWSGFFSWPKHTRQMIFRRKLGIALVICCFHGHGGVTKDSGESDCDIQISSHFKLIFLSLFF